MENKFIENLIKKYELTIKDEEAINAIIASILSLYYIADIQLVILKSYLRNKTKETITDDDTKAYALLAKETFLGKFQMFSTDKFELSDRSRIYQDFKEFKNLYNLGLFENSSVANIPEIVEAMDEFNIDTFANKNYCIRDVQIIAELDDLGIKDYITELLESKKLKLSK